MPYSDGSHWARKRPPRCWPRWIRLRHRHGPIPSSPCTRPRTHRRHRHPFLNHRRRRPRQYCWPRCRHLRPPQRRHLRPPQRRHRRPPHRRHRPPPHRRHLRPPHRRHRRLQHCRHRRPPHLRRLRPHDPR
ncbi:hypothetical protein FX016_01785 [Cupriavidus gilardii]|nr:hypothetical protein FX016_01785 [Cupriavidus gilardii]